MESKKNIELDDGTDHFNYNAMNDDGTMVLLCDKGFDSGKVNLL